MAAGSSIDALGQFELHPVMGVIGESLRFSQSPMMMIIAAILVLAFLYVGMRPAAVVPGRLQAAAEMCYDFIHNMAVDTIGPEGRSFFPFVFTLFFFILAGNYLGLLPFSFAFTSHIAVTLALALMVFCLSIIVSLKVQGQGSLPTSCPRARPRRWPRC